MDWPRYGGVKFKNVQMRYRDNLPLCLKGLSFKIKPQEKIGIVGRSGAGKIQICFLDINLVVNHFLFNLFKSIVISCIKVYVLISPTFYFNFFL